MTPSPEFAACLHQFAGADGTHPSLLDGVSVIRASAPTVPMPVLYSPTLCLAAQGRKRVQLGAAAYTYDAATYLVASVDLPVTGAVIEASPALPYLCLSIALDPVILSELALRHAAPAPERDERATGLALNPVTPELLDAALRLARLLGRPADMGELGPLLLREIAYLLLTRPGSGLIRQMALVDSRLNQIARAIVWLRAHFAQAWQVDDLAAIAGMSRSNFHAHFKAVTSMSPLEFRSRLRLMEGRRIMVAEAADAASAGFRVGYGSPSQFSRDYARAFGISPAKDALRLRADSLPSPHTG